MFSGLLRTRKDLERTGSRTSTARYWKGVACGDCTSFASNDAEVILFTEPGQMDAQLLSQPKATKSFRRRRIFSHESRTVGQEFQSESSPACRLLLVFLDIGNRYSICNGPSNIHARFRHSQSSTIQTRINLASCSSASPVLQ